MGVSAGLGQAIGATPGTALNYGMVLRLAFSDYPPRDAAHSSCEGTVSPTTDRK